MDLSKLPRLSETDKHSPQQQTPAHEAPLQRAEPMSYATPVAAPAGPEAWFSIVIGIIVQLMSTRFWSFVFSKLFGSAFTWTFRDTNGTPITYTQSVFFMGDVAMVLFGLVLIVEGIVFIFSRSRTLLMGAFILTCAATLLNLVFLVQMMSKGYGLQIMAALAVAFGGYIAMTQWRMLSSTARYSA
jgi:hypothetical protein